MFRNLPYDEDRALKRYAATPQDKQFRFNWRDVVTESFETVRPLKSILNGHSECIHILLEGNEVAFNLEEIAETVGTALTNLLLSRHETEIFTEQNRQFVARVVELVAQRLSSQVDNEGELSLGARDMYLLIEKALIDLNAHDVARSLVAHRAIRMGETRIVPLTTRLIRRNNTEVPWNQDKIEVAVRKAFLSLQQDSEPAVNIARAVTERVRELNRSRLHIEDVQDIVQEELMRQGYYKVAEAYILYRAHRSRLREEEREKAAASAQQQDSMIVVTHDDGSTDFWDGHDLRLRIQYARVGLFLDMTPEQLETELRRSLYPEMTEDDLRRTILLNAKTLIEQDADCAKFAGRILMTYIYEEVLNWSIERDGVGQLAAAHREAFRYLLHHGVNIERVNPKLREYDLGKLADALDPTADMDFDYLGIQTLYDRYLIVDKTGKRPRRLETPQLFWMRVAMGLFLDEQENREDWVIRLYQLYKSRRFCSSTPTLFNSGTLHSQLSSCYLYKVDDNIQSIMQRGIADNAYLS